MTSDLHRPFDKLNNKQIVFVLTLLGALFRFAELGSVRLTHDLAWQGWEAARIVNGVYPLIGQPSSVFLDNPPLMGYIQAIPLFFWRSPWSIFIFITFLNTLAIPFLYLAVEKSFGRRIAILSTVLFAINPWIVHFSRFTWTQGLLPLFLAIMFWGWLPSFTSASRSRFKFDWPFLAGFFALTAMCMTYILSFAMLIPVGLLMIVFWNRLPKKELLIGLIILAGSFAFYGWAVSQNIDQNSEKFLSFLDELGGAEPTEETNQFLNLTDDALKHAMRFVTGRDFVVQDLNGSTETDHIPVPIVSQIARWVLSAAFLAGLVRLLLKRDSNDWVLLVWFFMPVGLMMILPSSVFVHPHYLLFTLPAGGIIAAVGLDWSVQQHKMIGWGVAIFMLAIGLQFKTSLWQSGQAIKLSPLARGLSSLPLSVAADLGNEIRSFYVQSSDQVPQRIYGDFSHQIASSAAGMWLESTGNLQPPEWSLFPQSGPMLHVLPTHQLPVDVEAFAMIELLDRTTILLLEDSLEMQPTVALDIKSDSGLTFAGYSILINEAGGLDLDLFWRVDILHDVRHEWFVSPFVHLIDANGQTVANVAPHGQWGHRWRVGDVYVNSVTLDPPPNALKLGIGLFDPISGQTFLLHGPDGNIPRYEVDLPNR